ncbi:hypothetical protein FNF28_07457 [Cafeteria roenbergensis]|uniref:Uncharacterized protein n=1 Tax=Cafeteria roenbergensis TaxID=33653 RepID=A0A5A8C6K3_CAFRO|nr:hypothetical protein FNF28_07457 [Cafeteria roenbergensis]
MPAASESDADDEVVFSMPVYLNAASSGTVHLLQYPLRSTSRPTEAPSAAQWKPANRELSLSFAVPADEDHYHEDPPDTLKIHHMAQTSTLAPLASGLAVAVVRGSALHLTPVETVLQMRPDLGHIDRAAEANAASDPSNKGKAPTRLQSQARRRPDAATSHRQMTLAQLALIRESEEATPLKVFQASKAATDAALVAPQAREEGTDVEDGDDILLPSAPLRRPVGMGEYVAAMADDGTGDAPLAPKTAEEAEEEEEIMAEPLPAGGPGASASQQRARQEALIRRAEVVDRRAARALALIVRRHGGELPKVAASLLRRGPASVKAAELLRRAGAVPCARAVAFVRTEVPGQTDDEADAMAVARLELVGRLVRGCWTMRSDIKHDLHSAAPGAASVDVMTRRQAVRDLVLSAFEESAVVDRVQLCLSHGLVQADTREAFEAVAERREEAPGQPVWVWRWEMDGQTPADTGADLSAQCAAAQEAAERHAAWWARRREALTYVLRPTEDVDGSLDGDADAADDSDAERRAVADESDSDVDDAAAGHASSAPAAAATAAAAAAATSDADAPGTEAERIAALDAVTALFDKRAKARKSDVKASALKLAGLEVSDAVAVWALEATAVKEAGRGGYYSLA